MAGKVNKHLQHVVKGNDQGNPQYRVSHIILCQSFNFLSSQHVRVDYCFSEQNTVGAFFASYPWIASKQQHQKATNRSPKVAVQQYCRLHPKTSFNGRPPYELTSPMSPCFL